jgi:hypothetical protein
VDDTPLVTGYGDEGAEMLAARFIAERMDRFEPWLHARGEDSDSHQLALFRCRLPSVRSIVQFIEVALDVIQERHVPVSFTPLNQDLGDGFF